jgi:hypothetical protein
VQKSNPGKRPGAINISLLNPEFARGEVSKINTLRTGRKQGFWNRPSEVAGQGNRCGHQRCSGFGSFGDWKAVSAASAELGKVASLHVPNRARCCLQRRRAED